MLTYWVALEYCTNTCAASMLVVVSHQRLIHCDRIAYGQKNTMLMHGSVSRKAEEGGDQGGERVMGTGWISFKSSRWSALWV